MTSAATFQPHQAPSSSTSSSSKRLSNSGLFQSQHAPGQLPTADALFEALAMQSDPQPADPTQGAQGSPLSVHVQQLPTPRTSFSSGANSPPENLSPQSQYTHQPYLSHHLSSSQVTPTSMISAASSSVSTPSTDYPSTLASPNNTINHSDFTNASSSSSWNLSSSTTYSSSGSTAKTPTPQYQPQSYPSLRSASPAINGAVTLGPALYGPSSTSGSGMASSSVLNYSGSTAYNMGSSGLSQTVSSSYNNSHNASTVNFGSNYNNHDHASPELHELYYDEKEQQKKNARSALNNVASFLPPAVSQSLTKVVQQAQAVVGNNNSMSLPTTFGSSSSPSVSTTLNPSSARGMLLKLYKASKLPLLCLAWYLSSAVTNNIGKQIMNQFRYPVTLTFIQFLFVSLFCFLSGTVGLTKIRSPTVGIMQMTAPLVGFQVVGHVFSSVAISRVPLSVVHTIKALSPLFTVVFYRVILGTTYSRAVYISLVPLTAGVMLACRLSLEFNNLVGLVCALASTLVFVTQNVFTKRILFSTKAKQSAGLANKDNGEDPVEEVGSQNAQKLDKLNILFYSSTFAAICMVPIWLYAEGMGLMFADESGVYHHAAGHQAGFWSVAWLLFLNGFSHFFQNVFAFSVLALTSPVTYSIASLIKRIIVIVASIVYFHQTLGTTQWTGVCMTFWGLWLYNSAKNASKVSAPLGIISNTKLGRRVSRNFGGRGILDESRKGGFLA
ncbi:suppressor of loss of ypt1 [Podila minutissima]|nr:suppressor of loss of ypt1 [Podila minutissima]